MRTYLSTRRDVSRVRLGMSLSALSIVLALGLPAAAAQLTPDTKLRLSVVHWMPIEGEFRQWDALSADLMVSQQGTLTVPVIGSISIGDMSTDELAAEISRRLQMKMGLIDAPDANISIIEQPPIYVVGSVTSPGEYAFRSGLTVLQALALGGGTLRSEAIDASSDRIKLLSDLQDIGNETVRTLAQLARLDAELSGATQITFPPEVSAQNSLATEIIAQEQTVFTARANAMTRQAESLTELGELYDAEINVLQTKIANLDANIATTEKDLERISTLVDQGMATVSRRTDLQQLLGNMRADRLDQMTATMRARQYLNEAKRNMTTLRDQRQTEITEQLLTGHTDLERLHLRQATAQRLLQEMDRKLLLDTNAAEAQKMAIAYTVVRRENGESREFDAVESTQLLPGDVVRVGVRPTPQATPLMTKDGNGSPQ